MQKNNLIGKKNANNYIDNFILKLTYVIIISSVMQILSLLDLSNIKSLIKCHFEAVASFCLHN